MGFGVGNRVICCMYRLWKSDRVKEKYTGIH